MTELGDLSSKMLYSKTETIAKLLRNYELLKALNTVDSKMIILDLDEAVDKMLTDFQKAVVVTYFKSGHTQEETAEILGVYPTKVFIECLRVIERLKIKLCS